MPDLNSLLVFIGAGLLLNLAPGPDVLYVVGRSLSQGRAAGFVSALGIGAGCLFHVVAAACGLSALMLALPMAYDVVRYAGAAYLVWLGVRALLSKGGAMAVQAMARTPLWTIFRQGALTNVLNPKVAIFFLAFLPQFADPAHGPLAPRLLGLGLIFDFNGTLVSLGYALVASRLGDWLKSRYDLSTWLNRATGGLFIALGLRLALQERK
ncbi:MAG: LysE family translocator [Opitutae bacterium]|nr:LysE family translocator [Opitutae bacterium]